MNKRESKDGAKHSVIVGTQTRTTDVESSAFDTLNFQVNEIHVDLGIGGVTFDTTDKIEVELTKCDTVAGSYTAVEDTDVLIWTDGSGFAACDVDSAGVIKAFTAAHAAAARYVFQLIGPSRFYKLKFEFSGTHGTGTPLGAHLRQSEGRLNPPLA